MGSPGPHPDRRAGPEDPLTNVMTSRLHVHASPPKHEHEKNIFEIWPNTYRPNAGFPLPGHVMATPNFGPGTETWEEYGMESWEEYDRSLNKK